MCRGAERRPLDGGDKDRGCVGVVVLVVDFTVLWLTGKVRFEEDRALPREGSYLVAVAVVVVVVVAVVGNFKDIVGVRVLLSSGVLYVLPVLLGRGRLLTAVLTTVLFFSIVAVVVVVVDSFNGFTWRGGVVSNPRIIRSTRSAADRLASSVRVALSCFSPYGWRGEFEGSVNSFDSSSTNDFWSIGVST